MEDLDLVTVKTFLLRHEAEIARARLAADGIPAVVHADDEGGLNPGFYSEFGIRVAVRSEDAERARAMLERGETGEHVRLHPDHVEAFFAHTRFCAPEEACGLLAFDVPGRIRFVYALTNSDHSPYRFTVDAEEHYRALRHAEGLGWSISGSFHSHPSSPAEPSITDLERALDSGWIHVIVGTVDGTAEIAAYRVEGHAAIDVELVVD